ncbi:MAG: EamA family transporter [Actinomycetota bacterium]
MSSSPASQAGNRGSTSVARIPPEVLFIFSAIAQYIGAVIAVQLFDDASPASIAWFRVIGAALLLMCFSAPRMMRGHRWHREELIAAAIFGTAVAFMNLTFYLAIDRLDLGKGVAIEFIGPICVAAWQTRTKRNALALLLATIGVVVLSGLEISNQPLGLLYIFLASAMWATYIVIGAKVARLDRGVSGLGVGLLIGALVIAPFGVRGSMTILTTPWLLGACLLVGLFSNAIGYGIEQSILRRIPVRRFSVLLALLPVTALMFGFLFLHQRPSIIDLGGIVLVLTGVIVQQRDTLPTATTESA